MTFYQFMSKFPTEEAAINYFIKVAYGGILTCPHCGSKTRVYRYRQLQKLCNCKNCLNSFSPFTGTIFEKSSTDLRKWFFAMRLFLNDRKGVSSLNLHREIGVTQKTAWNILHKIRLVMEEKDMEPFDSVVEIDETYIGGKPKYTPPPKGIDFSLLDSSEGYSMIEYIEDNPSGSSKLRYGRGTDKTPVFGIKQRDTGKVYAQIMLPDEAGKELTSKQLLAVIEKRCKEGITIMTDDFSSYKALDKPDYTKLLDGLEPTPRYDHKTVCHSSRVYVAPGGVHTNGIESFWALIKRAYHGTYHFMSVKYMQRYLNEFCFRQNTRKLPSLDTFDLLLKRCVLKK
jgi:transposase-like protein